MKKIFFVIISVIMMLVMSSCIVKVGTDSSETVLNSEALVDVLDGKYILEGDFSLDGIDYIYIKQGKNVTLDLCGHKLNLNGTSIVVSGNFTVEDSIGNGEIFGGNGVKQTSSDGNIYAYGGAINIDKGTFTLNGGSIVNNEAYCGGGVYVGEKGKLLINGGEIKNNKAELGGGVCNYGTVEMKDGSVSANSSTYGGGIYSLNIFNFNGGTIKTNTSTYGGGVLSVGKMTMKAGDIVENVATSYGGGINTNGETYLLGGSVKNNKIDSNVGGWAENYGGGGVDFCGGSLTLGGEIAVTDNKSNGIDDNLFMEFSEIENNVPVKVSNDVPLSVYAQIGISHALMSTSVSEIKIIDGESDYSDFFISDNNNFRIYGTSLVLFDGSINGELHGKYTLKEDTVSDGKDYIYVKEGETVSIDLNGHTLDLNGKAIYVAGIFNISDSVGGGMISDGTGYVAEGSKIGLGGAVYIDGGVLNFLGGKMKNNTAFSGGAIYVNNGKVNINGGEISGNKADNAGGIYIINGTLYLYNGKITDNTSSTWGGGISLVSSESHLLGGEISGNTVTSNNGKIHVDFGGAGIEYYGSSLVLGGKVYIYDNLTDGVQDNLYLKYENTDGKETISVDSDCALQNGAKIGISHHSCLSEKSTVKISDNGKDYLSYFVSDNSLYEIKTDSSSVVLSLIQNETEKTDGEQPEDISENPEPIDIEDEPQQEPVEEKEPEQELDVDNIKKLADNGDFTAQKQLADLYVKGDKVKQDYTKAVELYRSAANGGNAEAQETLADIYYNGLYGVEQSFVAALKWYKKSAAMGLSVSQYMLGKMYANGEGVKQDGKKAIEWYEAAVKNGNKDAKKALEEMK